MYIHIKMLNLDPLDHEFEFFEHKFVHICQ